MWMRHKLDQTPFELVQGHLKEKFIILSGLYLSLVETFKISFSIAIALIRLYGMT